MLVVAAALAIIAVALAWPVPIALSAAAWPSRAPTRALLLWQAIAVAGGLAMIGAPLALGIAALGDDPTGDLAAVGRAAAAGRPLSLPLASVAALIVATLLAGYLLGTLVATIGRVVLQRRRHRALLELLSAPHPTIDDTRVLDDDALVAYCLPSGVGTVTVLSRGLLERLGPDEVRAVVAHERAHLRQRHDIVLVAFRAWHSALPGFPVAALAEDRVALLIEMLADDQARRTCGDAALAGALRRLAADGLLESVADATRGGGSAGRSADLRERLARLDDVT